MSRKSSARLLELVAKLNLRYEKAVRFLLDVPRCDEPIRGRLLVDQDGILAQLRFSDQIQANCLILRML